MKNPLESIQFFFDDKSMSELLIDGWENVYYEKNGQLIDAPDVFQNEAEVYDLIRHILEPLGHRVDEAHPFIDARLPDGSLVNVIVPPISMVGPAVTIRKVHYSQGLNMPLLVEYNSLSQQISDFLKACVVGRKNIVVAGGTSSGKTTFLNILAREIPDNERIIVCEIEPFRLNKKWVVSLEPRPADIDGRGEISMRDLIHNAAHMRPDRIIVTEVNGGETFHLLSLMNNGHDGTMFSLHAISSLDALARIEMMASLGNPAMPLLTTRTQIASAIDLLVYQERLSDGTRKITKISELTGVSDGLITTRDLFEFRRTGIVDGRVMGFHTATGAIPTFLQRLQEDLRYAHMEVPLSLFTPSA